MLKVKSNSWHYRLWAAGRNPRSRPKNLCKYFWHNVLKVAAALIVVGLALAGIGGILLVLYSFPVESFIVVSVIVFGISLIVGLAYFVHWGVTRIIRRRARIRDEIRWGDRPAPPPKIKGPPPAWWLALIAKKQKYCPLIQVVDEEAET